MPLITVLTLSYNKPKLVPEAIQSVLNQTFTNFEYLVVDNSTDGETRQIIRQFKDDKMFFIYHELEEKQRKKQYAESVLKNYYFEHLSQGKYLFFLADDDTLEPECLQAHIDHFNSNPKVRANYHSQRTVYESGDSWINENQRKAELVFKPGVVPCCAIDGGAVMFEKSLLKEMEKPYFPLEIDVAHYSDGIFLNRLSEITEIHPIDKVLHTKRVTRLSAHVKP